MNKFRKYSLMFLNSYVWLMVLLLIIDQVTKVAALRGMWDITVIPNFFYLHYTRNTGAAWSMFSNNMMFLAFISGAASGFMIWYRIYKRKVLTPIYKAAWALVIAGTLGNFIDRAFYEGLTGTPGVVDFLSFQFGSYHYPIFNVADMCVVIGLIGLIILISLDDRKAKKVKDEQVVTTIEEKK